MKDKFFSYYTYVLQSTIDDTLYIGSTNNLQRRIWEHDAKKSNFTKNKHPYKIIWHCVFIDDRAQEKALKFEKYLKSGSGREFIKKYVLLKEKK